jgi:branched-chain amino acid transport system ATP-binding protein
VSELRVSSVSRAFGGVQAVEDVSFVLEAGTVTALIGPNGAGKSTLFNLIDGQLEPDAGVIEFEGKPLSRMPTVARTRAGIGRTFQVAQTFASMTVLQNAQMALVAAAGAALSIGARLDSRARVDAVHLLRQVGLDDRSGSAAAALAYGDVKRLELALALAVRPRLLLMDEPTAGMAPGERTALMALVVELARLLERRCFLPNTAWTSCSVSPGVLVLPRGRLITTAPSILCGPIQRCRRSIWDARMTLALRQLSAWYGDAQVVRGATLTVNAGDVVALIGRNGAGKTSLLRAAMGLMPRASGAVELNGASIARLPPYLRARRGLGYVPEDRRIFTDLTVRRTSKSRCGPKRVVSMFPSFCGSFRISPACWTGWPAG